MNLDELHRKLMAAARLNPPNEAVPYAFEKRILARLQSVSCPDFSAMWARALWRAVAPCVAVMVLLSGWSLLDTQSSQTPTPDLSQALDNTVLAALDQDSALEQ